MNEIIIQAVGFLAVSFILVSFQMKDNHKLFLWQMLGCIVFFIQMFLMGAYSGAITLLINATRNYILIKSDDWKWGKSKMTLGSILLSLLVTTAYTWNGLNSLLPFACGIITTLGFWSFNARTIRVTQLIGSILFLIYDSIIMTFGGIISEIITSASIIISFYRFGWKNLGDE